MPTTLNYSAQAPASEMQSMLLRLPRDLMTQLSRLAPNRGRNQFVVEALQREIAQRKAQAEAEDDAMLTAAALRMNEIEAADPEFAAEGMEWVNAVLTEDDDDDFDRELFEREWAEAKNKRETLKARA